MIAKPELETPTGQLELGAVYLVHYPQGSFGGWNVGEFYRRMTSQHIETGMISFEEGFTSPDGPIPLEGADGIFKIVSAE